MEEQIPNPFLEAENYYKPYEDKIKELRNNPELIELDKLCFELFEMNAQGKRFMEIAKEKYLLYSLVQKGTPTYQIDVIWQEGFKDAFRMILMALTSHKQRIQAGNNQ